MRDRAPTSVKNKVAREAALLLYSSQEKEYKQAKEKAAKTLGARILPSNREIAQQLDKIADELEGSDRTERLVQMRKAALSIMVILGDFQPKLVGSVWRGTAHKNSDIDLEVFFSDSEAVMARLEQGGFRIRNAEWQTVTKAEEKETAFHIYVNISANNQAEIIVRDPEKARQTDKCEIYGDPIKGLSIHQLRRLLMEDPTRKIVPCWKESGS